ncbi:ABC-2 type transporter [Musa troglodytarum]|uniref:ABC-2 type transporter n=1 Tax=Musa troglodytarum TaxID=320322 RepID=A0A9E7K466_9LILI|nr:ABC-2 type transporter [Musa troglodytarum]
MASQSSVPRWTPSPSPIRPLRPRATAAAGDDIEMHGIDSPGGDEASFPFGYVPTTPPPLSPSPRHDDQLAREEVGGERRGGARKVGGNERREQQGVFLTWEDLWVSAPDRQGGRVSILSAITGYARPGEVLSIMGPSGCGKSTLLDALAGRLGSGVTQKGDILINGQRQKLAFGSSLQLPDSMSRSEKREAEAPIREMGLEGAMDTRIGGWAYKGISGGQKRRVSICIELLTRPQLLFLDEPTSGLDSAASYHVMDRITRLARREGMTVVAAIHQPSSEVFQLFHGLCLLAYGRTVFFGAASMANEGGALVKKRNPASFITQSLVLTRRSFVNMYRDLGYYWLRFAIYIALCLCVGTIFHDVGHSYGSIQARGSMLMFVAAFLTFMAIGGFPSFVEDMKIFGRERLNGHYGVTAFTIANTLSATPYLALISVIPGAIAYYLVGLQRSIDHFIYFALVLFMCMMLVEGLMMIVASIVPDFLMGIITGAGIQGVMMLNGGFFRLPNDLPKPVWRYPMYYIAFHKYANQGFYKNEFLGLIFPNTQAGGPPTINGDEILRETWQVEMGYSKWIDLVILFGMIILYRLMFLGIVKTVEKVKPMIKSLMFKAPEKSKHVMEQSSFETMA